MPVDISYNTIGSDKIYRVESKDVSADGLRIENSHQPLKVGDQLELKLSLPSIPNPVHAKGRIVWMKKLTLEDNAPYNYGIEIMSIEEDNKNTFLKFLCDTIYAIPQERKANSRKK